MVESLTFTDISPIEAIRLRMPVGSEQVVEAVEPENEVKAHLDVARKAQNHVDFWIFRRFGPLKYNTHITFKDDSNYHMQQGQHTLSADLDTPLGAVNVELTAEYEWTGGTRRFDADMQWLTAKFSFIDLEDSCYELTITDRDLDQESYDRKEDFDVWRRRQDSRRADRLPSREDLELFLEVLPKITEAMEAKYPYSSDVLKQTHPNTRVTIERWGWDEEVIR